MSAGCHKINFEVNTHDSFKYCSNQQASLGAVIFDMTATQIVSASSYNDLNILWDSKIGYLANSLNRSNDCGGYKKLLNSV